MSNEATAMNIVNTDEFNLEMAILNTHSPYGVGDHIVTQHDAAVSAQDEDVLILPTRTETQPETTGEKFKCDS